jgi:hypothetical protein
MPTLLRKLAALLQFVPPEVHVQTMRSCLLFLATAL